MLKFTLKIIKYIKNKYNNTKYIKINTENIYNYLTYGNMDYISKKICYYIKINNKYTYFSLLDFIKISKQSWLIKDKNVLIIQYYYQQIDYENQHADYNLFLFINIKNLDDIKIYKYENNCYKVYINILNNIFVKYINSFNFSVYKYTEIKNIEKPNKTNLNYLKKIKKTRLNNKNNENKELIFHYKNLKINKIRDLYHNYSYIFNYINYKIYIKFSLLEQRLYYYRNLRLGKIQLLLI